MTTCQKYMGIQQRAWSTGRLIPFYLGSTPRKRLRPTPQEYLNLRDLAYEIWRDFPADITMFFAIGRSPTPLVAFFEQFPQIQVRNVPGSLGVRKDRIDEGMIETLAELLTQIPASCRQLVLVDYCLTGATLACFLRLTREMVRAFQRPLVVWVAALAHEPSQANALQSPELRAAVRFYALERFPALQASFFREDYDRLAPFQHSQEAGSEDNRKLYRTFCRHLEECLRYDSRNKFPMPSARHASALASAMAVNTNACDYDLRV